jgi:hypothetical protein
MRLANNEKLVYRRQLNRRAWVIEFAQLVLFGRSARFTQKAIVKNAVVMAANVLFRRKMSILTSVIHV